MFTYSVLSIMVFQATQHNVLHHSCCYNSLPFHIIKEALKVNDYQEKRESESSDELASQEIDSMRDILSRKYQVSKYECVLEHNCKYKEDI